MPARNWYAIQATQDGDDKVTEIRIYDEIGFWGTSAKLFTDQLDQAAQDATRILVSINSPGGNVFDAFVIYNALVRHRLPVTTRVDGVAASAASLIFMAGSERVMPENAMLMIHNMWIVTMGTADELRKTADMMDKARDGALGAYARSGQPEAEIIRMLDETTWMSALDAQAMGFATGMEEPVKIAASANASALLEMLPGVSAELIASVQASDDASAPPPDDVPPPAPPDPPLEPEPAPNAAVPAQLVARVYSECRARKIPHLAEGILVSCSLADAAAVDARLDEAVQIAGICLAAKLSDRAEGFVMAGLGVEQVRARLFEQVVTAANELEISNLQRPQNDAREKAGPSIVDIYAARAAARRKS